MGDAEIDLEYERAAIHGHLLETRKNDWDHRVVHHPPRTEAVVQAHTRARALIGQVGHDLLDTVPPCPEVEKMLDALELALMHANAAIARRHPDNL